MAQNKTFRLGPIPLTTTLTTNLLNPPASSGGVNAGSSPMFIVLKHIRVTNRGALAVPFSLWLGASGANAVGTEVVGQGQMVAANSSYDWYGLMRIDASEFLVGGAGSASVLSLTGEGEIGVSG